jgi:predicted exporter
MSGRAFVLAARIAAIAAVSVACAWLTAVRLRLSTDLSTLFPESGQAAALARWTRAFGARDPALVLLRGSDPEQVGQAADQIAQALRHEPAVVRVVDRTPGLNAPRDPTLAWAFAGPAARVRMAQLLTPEEMRARLQETRALLLAPAIDQELQDWLTRDPLRLALAPWESRPELTSAIAGQPGGAFVADGGRARLLFVEGRGSPFISDDARALVEAVERAGAGCARLGVRVELSGGHAVAFATEQLMKRDLALSGTLSLVLASVAFVATFRRPRALVAVLPPLVLGTLWTTGLAAILPTGLSAVALAFAAVVVGVGVDTGIHVYAALLEARRAGLTGSRAAEAARAATARPTLVAASIAAAAFASLGLSTLRAIRQLGWLCGAGEVLTSIAILLLTPEIGAWLEHAQPPPPRPRAWVDWLDRLTSSGRRAGAALFLSAVPVALLAVVGWPRAADALVAIRPRALAPLQAEEHVASLFGDRSGQWIVLTRGGNEEAARARADRIAEALEPLVRSGAIEGFDSLATFAPAVRTRHERLAERDALDLPAHAPGLERALRETGFDVAAFAPAIEAFAHPSPGAQDPLDEGGDARAWLWARHVARDAGETLVATYVRPGASPSAQSRAEAAILAADPSAQLTGLYAIESELRASMRRDVLAVGAVAFVIVALSLRLALRSSRRALIALGTLATEVATVGLAMRVLGVRWHAYDALVLPVLFGITIDESMFLLDAAREQPMRAALRAQGPLVAATGLTTMAGFAALLVCRFDGLRDLGAVGSIGVLAGLIAALVVVPAGVRLLGARQEEPLSSIAGRGD